MIEHLGYEDIQMKGHPPEVYTTVLLTDRWPGKILGNFENIRTPPKIGSVFLDQYIVADYRCSKTFASYAFELTIYVVSPDNWTPTPDNEKYYGWHIQRKRVGCRDSISRVWVERDKNRGYIPDEVYI